MYQTSNHTNNEERPLDTELELNVGIMHVLTVDGCELHAFLNVTN